MKNILIISCIIFFFSQNLLSQSAINVIQSEKLTQLIKNDTIFQKFAGNVIIEYSNFKIQSDTILIDEYKELIQAWGNTHIVNDTLNCKSDSIDIKQKNNEITFHDNCVIKTNNMLIRSPKIQYNYKKETIKYSDNGEVVTNQYTINSKIFTHYIKSNNSEFSQNVMLKNNDYNIESNNIKYDGDILYFLGDTKITSDDLYINCKKGFLKESESLVISEGLDLYVDSIIVRANNLIRNLNNDENIFHQNVEVLIDSSTIIFGDKLVQMNNQSKITENCYIKLLNEKDSTLIRGKEINLDEEKNLTINEDVIILGKNIKGSCGDMCFTSNYQIIDMYKNPVIWLEKTQITGKEIQLQTTDNNLDSIYIPSDAFIISPVDSLNCYNQIKGNLLKGNFENNEIKHVTISGNSEMHYFDNNKEKESYLMLNQVQSSTIQLFFKQKNMKKVIFLDEIDSKSFDLKKDQITDMMDRNIYLEGFYLHPEIN